MEPRQSLAFTEFVCALEAGQEPPAEAFEAAWDKLQSALRNELKKRSLLSASPRFVGIGCDQWSDAFEDLLQDCYLFVFCARLAGLKASLEKRDNVEGVVFLSIRNFLYDRQKKHDPLGFGVFTVLQAVLRELLDSQTLHFLAGDRKIRNETILSFVPESEEEPASASDLGPAVRPWTYDLLRHLVQAGGMRRDTITSTLVDRVARLRNSGIQVFRVKDMLDPLKREVREHWRSTWSSSEGAVASEDGDREFQTIRLTRCVAPDSGFEERQFYANLIAGMDQAVRRLRGSPSTAVYSQRLWEFVKIDAIQSPDARPPSRLKLAALLDIPRNRLPGLYSLLGRELEACQARLTGTRSLEMNRGR